MRFSTDSKAFKSGDLVPASGVYLILHSTPHGIEQRELYLEGSRFPECRICPAGVLYRLESPCVKMQMPMIPEMAVAAC